MKLTDCEWETPVILRERGDWVEIKAKKSGNLMRGKLTKNMTSDHRTFVIVLDGTEAGISLRRDEWYITLLEPPIEEGIYVGMGNIYHISESAMRGTDANLNKIPINSLLKRKTFARLISEGKVRRVAPLHGTW